MLYLILKMKLTNQKIAEVVNKITKDMEIRRKNNVKNDNNKKVIISTGSTLLDLAISGTAYEGGGLVPGILVEIFGPAGSGKTVLLSEIAGNIQKMGGKVVYYDPEGRLNRQFAKLFGLDFEKMVYSMPNTVTEMFSDIRNWEISDKSTVNGIFADSLAALSTELEMENDEGDKMGMRRAKEFSEQLRKTCRLLVEKNILMVCSNQIRQNVEAGPYSQKYVSPGGEAIPFYSSVRLRTYNPKKIKVERIIGKNKIERVVGVEIEIEVFKNSIDKPYRTAPLTILFDYGIDDIRENLKFLKTFYESNVYIIDENTKLSNSLEKSIEIVEKENLAEVLKQNVIKKWYEIENFFVSRRIKNS